MSALLRQTVTDDSKSDFDLFRISKSKKEVDLAPNTVRSYIEEGLPFYKRGKATFISKKELAAFIMGVQPV